jgi:hypothetical protein
MDDNLEDRARETVYEKTGERAETLKRARELLDDPAGGSTKDIPIEPTR